MFLIPPNQFLVFFRDPEQKIDPQWLGEYCRSRRFVFSGDQEPFLVKRTKSGPEFFLIFYRGLEASILCSRLMGSDVQYPEYMNSTDAYLRVCFADLDAVLDDFNDLMEVETLLQEATDGLLYFAWNQLFTKNS